jgi:hypothetical protein
MSFYYRPSLIKFNSDEWQNGADFILSDHGRDEVQVSYERIENRVRMANGRMRSKWIADKRTFGLSWEMLPSRSVVNGVNVVSDGYASAGDLKSFYTAVQGEFTATIYADTGYGSVLTPSGVYGSFGVYLSDFSVTIHKRGKNFDFMNVTMALEEA